MKNPAAITDEVLDKIEKLLRDYDYALDNILYKNYNPTKDRKAVREALAAIEFARHGESDEELMRSIEEFGG